MKVTSKILFVLVPFFFMCLSSCTLLLTCPGDEQEICFEGACYCGESCQSSNACEIGESCLGYASGASFGVCVDQNLLDAPDEVPCVGDEDCLETRCMLDSDCLEEDTICTDGECVQGCRLDRDSRGTVCGSSCVRLRTDPDHCGECGNACDGGTNCISGDCICTDGTTWCGDQCVDLDNDPSNCGGCGTVCGALETCLLGSCECLGEWFDRCDDTCVETRYDNHNCGGCGIVCGPRLECVETECLCAAGPGNCEDGLCINDYDCGPGQICSLGTDATEDDSLNFECTSAGPGRTLGESCDQDSDCARNVCVEGTCRAPCEGADDCAQGDDYACERTVIERPSGTVDARICVPSGPCTATGQRCDLNQRIQGDFACLSRDGVGRCFETCEDAFSASDCGPARYCFDASDGATSLNVCFESECATEADCGQDSCILFDNDFGSCVRAGQRIEGQTCLVSINECEQGTICRRQTSGLDSNFPPLTETEMSIGVCSRVCDFFATTSDCPAGQSCGPWVSPRAGLCSTENTGSGTSAYESCSDSGEFCADGLRCLRTSGGANFCFPYCRPGEGDCDAILPDGSDGACLNDFFPGTSALGVCSPPCDPAQTSACGVGRICVDNGFGDNICRRTCSAGNEVEDCCNGSSPCAFVCNADNLCE